MESDLLRESLDKVKFIQEKLLATPNRQKEYAVERLETWILWRVSKSCLRFRP